MARLNKKQNVSPALENWLVGGGETGRLIRSIDWSQTSLGPLLSWPSSLRSAVSLMLASKAQIILFWGSELITLYNDASLPLFGMKQPRALGMPVKECWSEIWGVLEPLLKGVLRTGEGFWAKDHLFYLERRGYIEETYFDLSYAPVHGESGTIGGIFCIVSETTGKVLGERRLKTLSQLGSGMSTAHTIANACSAAVKILSSENPVDLPYTLLYILEEENKACLIDYYGITPDEKTRFIDLQNVENEWVRSLARAKETKSAVEVHVEPVITLSPSPASSEWRVVLPLNAGNMLVGFLIAGISRFVPLDESYRHFLDLVASQISTTLTILKTGEDKKNRGQEPRLNEESVHLISESTPAGGRRPRILLAADNAAIRDHFGQLFGNRYDLESVPDGQAALKAARARRPDLLLTDVRTAGADGFELVRALRQEPTTRTLPIILLSGHIGEEARVEGLEAGVDDYLIKPFSERELMTRVSAHLNLAHMRIDTAAREYAALRKTQGAEARLREVLHSMNDGFIIMDRDWRYRYVNPRAAVLLGRLPDLLYGQTIWEQFPQILGGPVYQKLHQAKIDQKPTHFEIYEESSQKWFEHDVYPSEEGLIIFFSDITQRKKAEGKVAFQADLLNVVEQAVIATDLEGAITFWNRFAEKLYGWRADEVIGRNILEVTPTQFLHEQVNDIIERQKAGQSWSGEFLVQRREGGMFPAMAITTPIFDQVGKVVGMISVSSDITVKKQAEELLLRKTAAAEELSHLKSKFVSTVSHELRTPLNAIIGFSTLLRNPKVNQDLSKYTAMIDHIHRNAKNLVHLINTVLDFSKIEAGQMIIKTREVIVIETLREVVNDLRFAAEEKGLKLELTIHAIIPSMRSDPGRLHQIFANLIWNAIKYTQKGSISVRVRNIAEKKKIRIEVEDTGVGMSEDQLSHIFEPFYQIDQEGVPSNLGTGLGLSIAKEFTHLLGGTIEVVSRLQEGSRFTVTLPYNGQ